MYGGHALIEGLEGSSVCDVQFSHPSIQVLFFSVVPTFSGFSRERQSPGESGTSMAKLECPRAGCRGGGLNDVPPPFSPTFLLKSGMGVFILYHEIDRN